MSIFYSFFKGIVDGIPILLGRIGSILVSFFFFGALFGYYLYMTQVSILYLAFLAITVPVMWRNLDQGVLLFILVLLVPWVFPGLI